MSIDLDDPFALPSEAKVSHRGEIITGGRYRLPRRDGSKKPWGWMRVTNLVGAYSDQFGLRMWEFEQVLRGLAVSPDAIDRLRSAVPGWDEMTKSERRSEVEQFVEAMKDVSGGNAGAKHGTHRHAVVEAFHAGLPLGYQGPITRRQLALYASALERNRLVAQSGMQERRVLIEALEAVGTLDNIVRDLTAECQRIADLKTQRRFWTWLEIGAQFSCYANADAMWDEATGTWVDMPKVNREIGLVLWMPRPTCTEPDCGKTLPCPDHPSVKAEPHVDVYEVDLVAGWATARRAFEVIQDRSEARSTHSPRAWLRPAPPVTLTEQYAARFAAVETMAEGSRLVREATDKGVWDEILADCARKAAARMLTVTRI